MIDHIGDYDGLYEDILNADQPDGRVRFRTTEKRLAAMSNPTALTGEPEVFALSPMLCKPVILVDTQLRSIIKYNLDKLRGEQVLYARYVSSGADVGHCNCVLYSPSQLQDNEPELRPSADRSSRSQPVNDHQPTSDHSSINDHQPTSNSQPTTNQPTGKQATISQPAATQNQSVNASQPAVHVPDRSLQLDSPQEAI